MLFIASFITQKVGREAGFKCLVYLAEMPVLRPSGLDLQRQDAFRVAICDDEGVRELLQRKLPGRKRTDAPTS